MLAIVLTQTALAQDGPAMPTVEDSRMQSGCLANAVEQGLPNSNCIGKVADACMGEPGHDSTAMMTACLDRETRLWDDMLNDRYGLLMDALNDEQATALQSAQRAWIDMRDKTCAYEASLWQGGTGAGPAAVGCFLRETGWRALILGDTLDFATGN
ncbi:MAG TPA: lysozyme inhibitor LprI family protein [Methylomirabilota bacterium]|nr:lysozyme inhibitor LprI family protein [Methylomirabilota bacterium]